MVSAMVSPVMPRIVNLPTRTIPLPTLPSGAGGGDSSRVAEGGVEAAAIAARTRGGMGGTGELVPDTGALT